MCEFEIDISSEQWSKGFYRNAVDSFILKFKHYKINVNITSYKYYINITAK